MAFVDSRDCGPDLVRFSRVFIIKPVKSPLKKMLKMLNVRTMTFNLILKFLVEFRNIRFRRSRSVRRLSQDWEEYCFHFVVRLRSTLAQPF